VADENFSSCNLARQSLLHDEKGSTKNNGEDMIDLNEDRGVGSKEGKKPRRKRRKKNQRNHKTFIISRKNRSRRRKGSEMKKLKKEGENKGRGVKEGKKKQRKVP